MTYIDGRTPKSHSLDLSGQNIMFARLFDQFLHIHHDLGDTGFVAG